MRCDRFLPPPTRLCRATSPIWAVPKQGRLSFGDTGCIPCIYFKVSLHPHLLFPGSCGLPGIVVCNVIDDLDGTHAPIPELDMGLGIVVGGEVDLGGAFVVEGLFRGVIVEAPVRQRRGVDDRLVEETALEAMLRLSVVECQLP